MKYIKVFDEMNELHSSTYRNAGTKMITDYKQTKRGTQLIDYSYQVTRNKYKNSGTYECNIIDFRKTHIGGNENDTLLVSGNFHIAFNIDYYWFKDEFIDGFFESKKNKHFPIQVGLIPADDETLKKMLSKKDVFYDYHNDVYWINMLYVPMTGLNNDTYANILVESNNGDFVEFRFNSRKDAVKFKKYLMGVFNDDIKLPKENFYDYKDTISELVLSFFNDVNSDINTYLNDGSLDTEKEYSEDEIPFYDIDQSYMYLVDKLNKISINKLYRD